MKKIGIIGGGILGLSIAHALVLTKKYKVHLFEKELNTKAKIKFLPKQKGDVQETFSNIQKIRMLGYNPKTNVKEGIKKFVKWYREYYKK